MPDHGRRTARLSPQAEVDFDDILRWSRKQFGADAALRYAELIIQALRDLEADPARLGARPRDELPTGVCAYHLTMSRDHVAGDRVKAPRHFVLYRTTEQEISVLRILHDSRDLARHLPDA